MRDKHTPGSGPKAFHVERQHALRERLPMWTVCRPTTTDFEGMWLARMHLSLPSPEPTDLLIVGETLESVREQLPGGLTNIGRQQGDDPVIHEVWL
ncbi:hypothetical protein HLH33_17160 [Gluconacetobacter diazotrophicus]|uniref:Uncharacterized protein n=1 Tax=Gluconacetobacter diazotrophicus TaxID=33996 RepID=A0A7W4I830_GLUDI|nr:hypothetical protein [Gluconacetobacter diazotrophicus]MBB2158003.1 hypothetical protein [Gluconacetobacter diazotrophicus]